LPNLPAHAVISADFDGDGDLDWVASTVGESILMFENISADGCDRNWLSVDLVGRVSNREGIGATVEVELDDGSTRRRVMGSGGVAHASLPTLLHFGLGERSVTRLRVNWPSGKTSSVDQPRLRGTLRIRE